MQVQPPQFSDGIVTTGQALPWVRHRVWVADAWDGEWTAQDYLECQTLTWCAAPGVSIATLLHRAGSIKWEDETEPTARQLLSLDGKFIRVDVLNPTRQATDPQSRGDEEAEEPDDPEDADEPGNEEPVEVLVSWYGQIAHSAHDLAGNQADAATNAADQAFTAYGLEQQLQRITIDGTYVLGNADDGVKIHTPIAFNQRHPWGPGEAGNRTQTVIEVDGPDVTAHVFDGRSDTGGAEWTVLDAVQYLLCFFGPDTDAAPRFDLAGQHEALAEIPVRSFNPMGKSLKQCLDELISPRQGFGWCVRLSTPEAPEDPEDEEEQPDPPTALIHVFTVALTPVGMSEYTLPANPEVAVIDLTGGIEVEQAQVTEDSRVQYGRVVVQGQRLLVCGTFSVTDGTLEKGWTTSEQNSYVSPPGAGPAQLDENRQIDSLRHVWQLLRVPDTWDFTTGDGEGGSRSNANPLMLPTGALDPEQQAPVRSGWGLIFERNLPLLTPRLIEGLKADYQDSIGFVRDPTDSTRWIQLDALPAHIRPLDNDLGVLLTTSPPHLLAKNHVSGIVSRTQPVYDYEDVAITAAWRSDQALRVEATIPVPPRAEESDEAYEARKAMLRQRVLRVDVPDAQMWYVVPRTAVSTTELHDGGVIRDDGPILRRVATGVVSWFGRVRSALALRVGRVMLWPEVGALVERYDEGTDRFAIETVVTQRSIDLTSQRTTLSTSFVELEFDGGRT